MRAPLALLLVGAACACRAGAGERGAPAAVLDVEGRAHTPLAPAAGRSSVLFFVLTDCPIANALAPEIQSLIEEHAASPLDFYLVYLDPSPEPGALRAHARAYGYRATILSDADQELARALGVTHTPEAAVVTSAGTLSYRGRIDDRYGALGRRRPAATRRDLHDHLEALVAGRPLAPARTEAVGCLLPDIEPAE